MIIVCEEDLRADGGLRQISLGCIAWFFRLVTIQEVEMVDQCDCLDREHCCDILVVDHQQVVAVNLLASKCQVGGTAGNHRARLVKAAYNEFMMNLMGGCIRNVPDLAKGFGENRPDRFAGY